MLGPEGWNLGGLLLAAATLVAVIATGVYIGVRTANRDPATVREMTLSARWVIYVAAGVAAFAVAWQALVTR